MEWYGILGLVGIIVASVLTHTLTTRTLHAQYSQAEDLNNVHRRIDELHRELESRVDAMDHYFNQKIDEIERTIESAQE